MSEDDAAQLSRRDMLKVGLVAGGAAMIGPLNLGEGLAQDCGTNGPGQGQCPSAIEVYPTSPLIGGRTKSTTKGKTTTFTVNRAIGAFDAFKTEPLPIPTILQPTAVGTLPAGFSPPLAGQTQDCYGDKHQVGADGYREDGTQLPNYNGTQGSYANTKFYDITLQVGEHRFTQLEAVPINAAGAVVTPPAQPSPIQPVVQNQTTKRVTLPGSTIWGFNGHFPGPMIKAQYGEPCVVRLTNQLGNNPNDDQLRPTPPDPNNPNAPVSQFRDISVPIADFGAHDRAFLTHLHNGHTAPESDGNPYHKPCPYGQGDWVQNLYLNWPAGGDDREKQSFLWFHDHRMDHTGANVYKGLVGLYPLYDPVLDPGDERQAGLHLPGVPSQDGSRIDYDIPLVFFDCRLDDGVTPHQDFHSGCGETRPDLYGRTFYRHFPDNGFVGDVFTVNGKACPVLKVKRRKYRFRFLDASIARQYEFKLMREKKDGAGNVTVGVAAAPGQQGQYNFVDLRGRNALGEQCMQFTQIASDGGLLPAPIVRDSIEIWPAKRREVVIDFTHYQDNGTATQDGEEIYLVNVAQMLDGRKRADPRERGFDANYCVPVLKFVIEGNEDAPDASTIPSVLRPLAPLPDAATLAGLTHRTFRFTKADVGGEFKWTINGQVFHPTQDGADPAGNNPILLDRPEVWTFINEGGGWTHPIHIHQEEHRITLRNGQPAQGGDISREDVVSLQGGEEVSFYRNFRTFTGKYVAHCHNLAHEDHAMMFGWEIKKPS